MKQQRRLTNTTRLNECINQNTSYRSKPSQSIRIVANQSLQSKFVLLQVLHKTRPTICYRQPCSFLGRCSFLLPSIYLNFGKNYVYRTITCSSLFTFSSPHSSLFTACSSCSSFALLLCLQGISYSLLIVLEWRAASGAVIATIARSVLTV